MKIAAGDISFEYL